MQEVQDRFEQAVTHIVLAILTARQRQHRPVIPEPLATVAAQAAVNAFMKRSAIRQFDDLLHATGVLVDPRALARPGLPGQCVVGDLAVDHVAGDLAEPAVVITRVLVQ